MNNSTKIIIGAGILGVGYYFFKKYSKLPSSNSGTSTTNTTITNTTNTTSSTTLSTPKTSSSIIVTTPKVNPIIDPKSGKLVNSYITDNPTDNGLSGGSFDMKTTRDTTLENIGSSLDSLTTMGKDYTNILNPTGYQDTPSGTIIRRGDPSDPYGYGYVTSA